MTIDFHMHIGEDIQNKTKASLDDIERVMKNARVKKAVLFCFNSREFLEESNKILQLSQKHSWIIPFLRFDPRTITPKQLTAELEKGYKGIKLHTSVQHFYPHDPKFTWIFKKIQKKKIPVLFHNHTSIHEPRGHPKYVLTLAKRFPKITFVIGHAAGGEEFQFEHISKIKNVYVETSLYSQHSFFESVYRDWKFDRFLFGSDFPFSLPEIEIMKINLARIPKELKRKILYKNAEKILRLR